MILGKTGTDSFIGYEFAGRRTDTGERVIGISPGNCVTTKIKADPNSLITIPNKWSIEEAASTLNSYYTVWQALIKRVSLEAGKESLIFNIL